MGRVNGDRGGARAEHIKLTTHFPEKIIIRYPVFVRVFTFFLKTNFIIERFVESSPNPTRTYFRTLASIKRENSFRHKGRPTNRDMYNRRQALRFTLVMPITNRYIFHIFTEFSRGIVLSSVLSTIHSTAYDVNPQVEIRQQRNVIIFVTVANKQNAESSREESLRRETGR